MSDGASLRLVLLGTMGGTPFAGVAWQVLHYLEGFRRLGCDVYYLEDTSSWPYDPEQNTITDDSRYAVRYIGRLMEWLGMPERWAYVAPDHRFHGLSKERVARLLEEADALVNLTGSTVLREEHLTVPRRIYLETDPVLRQIEMAQGQRFAADQTAAHTHHFSYGENLGAPDCGVPVERFHPQPTRQPIILEWWRAEGTDDRRFTTVGNWHQPGYDVEWMGETYYWSKDREFMKFIELPERTGEQFELALAIDDAKAEATLESHGWRVIDGMAISRDIHPYREYVKGSGAEFTVAKDQNVRLRSGWFSDRSASYLAAGRPVVTQDTGFGKALPTGCGLFAFRSVDEAQAAVAAIAADYARHSTAARELAAEYFAAEKVLASLLERVDGR